MNALKIIAIAVSLLSASLVQASGAGMPLPEKPSKDAVCRVVWLTHTRACGQDRAFECADDWIRQNCKVGDVAIFFSSTNTGLSFSDGHEHMEKYCSVLDMRELVTGQFACRIAVIPPK